MALSRRQLLMALAGLVIAFGAAFAVGKAAGGTDSTGGAAKAERFELEASDSPSVAGLEPAGKLPALRREGSRPSRSGGGASPSAPSGPATPTPSDPGPSPGPSPSPAPAPTPTPTPTPPDPGPSPPPEQVD